MYVYLCRPSEAMPDHLVLDPVGCEMGKGRIRTGTALLQSGVLPHWATTQPLSLLRFYYWATSYPTIEPSRLLTIESPRSDHWAIWTPNHQVTSPHWATSPPQWVFSPFSLSLLASSLSRVASSWASSPPTEPPRLLIESPRLLI